MNAKIETKWSDEPWTEQTAVFIEKGSDRVLLGPLSIPAPRDCRVLFEPNYQRAMACVNACAGMENPITEIERLKHLEDVVRNWVVGVDEGLYEIDSGKASLDHTLAAFNSISDALDKLKP